MNKRKLQRANKKKNQSKADSPDNIITLAAQSTANAAVKSEVTLNCLGNFIFFSTKSGEGWMLDHRKNCALRLAEKGSTCDYTILETKERFQVEWKERFRIEGDTFVASLQGKETVFYEYPIDALTRLIGMLMEKNQTKKQ
jgi:hypothetical protein